VGSWSRETSARLGPRPPSSRRRRIPRHLGAGDIYARELRTKRTAGSTTICCQNHRQREVADCVVYFGDYLRAGASALRRATGKLLWSKLGRKPDYGLRAGRRAALRPSRVRGPLCLHDQRRYLCTSRPAGSGTLGAPVWDCPRLLRSYTGRSLRSPPRPAPFSGRGTLEGRSRLPTVDRWVVTSQSSATGSSEATAARPTRSTSRTASSVRGPSGKPEATLFYGWATHLAVEPEPKRRRLRP